MALTRKRENVSEREWFAIRTKVHKEFIASQNFSRQGFSVYLPIIRKELRHARRVDIAIRPFFPGYLFLHLAPMERNWITIGSTIGAVGPVHFGEQYPSVPEAVIRQLRLQEDKKGFILPSSSRMVLQKGMEVTLSGRELEGVKGIFMEMRGEDRALILLEILRRRVVATIPLGYIITD